MQKIRSIDIAGGSVTITGASKFYVDQVIREVRKIAVSSVTKEARSYLPELEVLHFIASSPRLLLQHAAHRGLEFLRSANPEVESHRSARPNDGCLLCCALMDGSSSSRLKHHAALLSCGAEGIREQLYKEQLRSLLWKIYNTVSRKSVLKFSVRLGKSLFKAGPSPCGSAIATPLELHQMSLLDRRFSDEAICSMDVALLLMFISCCGYAKVDVGRKVRLFLVDATSGSYYLLPLIPTKSQMRPVMSGGTDYFMPSQLFDEGDDGNDGSGSEVPTVRRVLAKPNRHCFIWVPEGKLAESRLAVLTREEESLRSEELVAIAQRAWSSRAPNGMLMFDSEVLGSAVRYKENHKFRRGDMLVKVAKVVMWEDQSCRYEWLKSLWLKENLPTVREIDELNEACIGHVQALLVEAGKVTEGIGELRGL